jgi:hypothetical protein
MRQLAFWTLALGLAGCGTSAAKNKSANSADDPPAASATKSEEPKTAAAKDNGAKEVTDDAPVPTKCAKQNPCVPAGDYVKKLCKASYPAVALSFFRGGTPWQRGYLTRRTEGINASGGISGGGFLEFDEEVIVLQQRKNDYGGMQVSGAMGGYYVLRWDGTCNDIAGEELTFNKPPQPKAAKVEWRFLDEATQEALRADEKLNQMINARRQECKGASSGEVSKKCVDLDKKLSEAIAKTVRAGIELPVPSKHP